VQWTFARGLSNGSTLDEYASEWQCESLQKTFNRALKPIAITKMSAEMPMTPLRCQLESEIS
jgi:hypothetical protein